jgi:hypothetical protein
VVVSEARLERLRNAPAYREREHDILIVDTAALLSSHVDEVTLSPMNSGATHPGAKYTRGADMFKPMNSYPWDVRLKKNRNEPVVELAVRYSVPDIETLVTSVERR